MVNFWFEIILINNKPFLKSLLHQSKITLRLKYKSLRTLILNECSKIDERFGATNGGIMI